MTNGEILNLVSGHPFLTGLPDACLELIANHGQLQSFAKGDYLTREKQIANQFFLMLDGHVRLEMQTHTGTTTIETVSAPAALGWSWLVYPHKWHYASMALDRVETVCVQAQPILTALQQDKKFWLRNL